MKHSDTVPSIVPNRHATTAIRPETDVDRPIDLGSVQVMAPVLVEAHATPVAHLWHQARDTYSTLGQTVTWLTEAASVQTAGVEGQVVASAGRVRLQVGRGQSPGSPNPDLMIHGKWRWGSDHPHGC